MTLALQKYMVTAYGHTSVYGLEGDSGGIERIKKEIADYEAYAILQSCSKIGLTLFAKGIANTEAQIKILLETLPLGTRKMLATVINKNEGPKSPWSVFTEQSVLMLVKLAFLYGGPDGLKAMTGKDLHKLGNWFLILNEEGTGVDGEPVLILPVGLERERLREFLARQHFNMVKEFLPYRVVRFTQLFDKLQKIGLANGVNIQEIFSKATNGANFDDYTTICFSLIVNWINKSQEPLNLNSDWLISKGTYFKNTLLDGAMIDKVFESILLKEGTFLKLYEDSVKNVLNGTDYFAYNFLPLQQFPLIHYKDDSFMCPSPQLLMDKATEGIYWTLESYLRTSSDQSTYKLLPKIWGDAFDEHIAERFTSAFGKDKYFPNYKTEGIERADGILNGELIIGFVESKYAHWSYRAQLTGKKSDMDSTLNQLFSKKKGLGQLTKNIKALGNREWQLPFEINSRKILPILVTGETMPQDLYNRKMYEDFAKTNGSFYESTSVLPFIVLDAEEVEIVEAISLVEGKSKTEEILLEYSLTFGNRDIEGFAGESISFKTYLDYRGYKYPQNPEYQRLFRNITDQLIKRAFNTQISPTKQ